MQAQIVMYASALCGYCNAAKHLLDTKGVVYTEITVDGDPATRRRMSEMTGRGTVPQIFIGTTHVGGYDDLHGLDQLGKLDELIWGATH